MPWGIGRKDDSAEDKAAGHDEVSKEMKASSACRLANKKISQRCRSCGLHLPSALLSVGFRDYVAVGYVHSGGQ